MIARIHRSEEGAGLIELAVVLPLLALLVVGIVETGRYLAFSVRLSNAAHAGAQFGSQNQAAAHATSDIASAACSDSQFTCTTATPAPGATTSPDTMLVSSSVWCTYSDGSTNANCPDAGTLQRNMFVQVSTSGTFKPLLHLPLMPNAVPMSAVAIVQVGE